MQINSKMKMNPSFFYRSCSCLYLSIMPYHLHLEAALRPDIPGPDLPHPMLGQVDVEVGRGAEDSEEVGDLAGAVHPGGPVYKGLVNNRRKLMP